VNSFETAKRLRALGQRHWPSAVELLSALQDAAAECGRFQFAAVLSGAAKATSWPFALRVLGNAPDVAAYTTSVLALEKASQWSLGLQHIQRMATTATPPDLKAWTAATQAAGAAAGRWQAMLAMRNAAAEGLERGGAASAQGVRGTRSG
ncbi:unnamed protein product, partial [Durusdinium trenchii]